MSDEHLDVFLGVVPGGAGEGLEPRRIAVVVSAEQIDLVGEAAVSLAEVIRGVGCEVRVVAVEPADDVVLIVTEVGCAYPYRARLGRVDQEVSLLGG